MNEDEPTKRPLTRSPNYPSIDLGRAIERVQLFHKTERQYKMPALQAVRHWGYSSLNSAGGGQLAALARFGLVGDEGTREERKVWVTDEAVKILHHPDRAERRTAIRHAALLPSVHEDMWQKYGDELPSEDNLKWFLTRKRGFSENGAKDFVREYRATIEFAQLRADHDEKSVATPHVDGGDRDLIPSTTGQVDPPAEWVDAPFSAGSDVAASPSQSPPISFPLASGKIGHPGGSE